MRFGNLQCLVNQKGSVPMLLLGALCVLLVALLSACGGGETDRDALVALYLTTNGSTWDRTNNWLSDAPIGEWYGVSTGDDGRVTEVNLRDNDLSGEIPGELGSLANLEVLDLEDNRLKGEIPSDFRSLAKLERLSLGGNMLSGCIPDAWGERRKDDVFDLDRPITSMRAIGLPFCEQPGREDRDALVALYLATDGSNWEYAEKWLSGAPIGEWYGVATDDSGRVTGLELSGNNLSARVPGVLGRLTSLEVLDVAQNRLRGEIPAELDGLDNLIVLNLANNDLSGAVPATLGSLTNLTLLNLAHNYLSGEILSRLGRLDSLQALNLQDNRFREEIPPELASLSNLTELNLQDNLLSGCIPDAVGVVRDSDLFDLGLPFCGTLVPGDRSALVTLYISTGGPAWVSADNWMSDAPIGEWYGVTIDDSNRVTGLCFSDNGLSGEIPPELGSLTSLEILYLHGNQIGGKIPAQLGRLAKLEDLSLNHNRLSGEIPPELGNLASLVQLTLGKNQLSGEIPPELGNLASLRIIEITYNQLSGEIPPALDSLTNLERLHLEGNKLTGKIPSELSPSHRSNSP